MLVTVVDTHVFQALNKHGSLWAILPPAADDPYDFVSCSSICDKTQETSAFACDHSVGNSAPD